MINVIEIKIDEFKSDIYKQYIQLFPKDEQRELKKIENSYNDGLEKFYKIVKNDQTIGFFMLEKLKEDYPYYLDYFAIFKEFRGLGYGTKAMKILLDRKVLDKGLIAEIEKVCTDNPITVRRFEFYKKLGFKKIESEYLLYNVYYNPIVYCKFENMNKEKYDRIFFDYYLINCGENEVKNNCKIIR
jgi:ribosomal protein S18 acetylase RimI-like enzyme